ncbi:hypothetical protein [Natronoglycomyces albus]|uniref:Secreted protein n=1 Tax=Natronoglycomyces albus TaxID=2811108 RepID=A0A895XLQ1_9ACTN|nr:hypothetical protein [Natronoglycomyces albus]QSB03885.1 hypothetical protein JQS30_08590 [Natronoglycomyces albus]
MFKRILWLGVGVAVGVIVVRKVTKAAECVTPGGIAHRVQESAAGIKSSARQFWNDVSAASADKELQLWTAMERGEDVAPLLSEEDDEDIWLDESPPGRSTI